MGNEEIIFLISIQFFNKIIQKIKTVVQNTISLNIINCIYFRNKIITKDRLEQHFKAENKTEFW